MKLALDKDTVQRLRGQVAKINKKLAARGAGPITMKENGQSMVTVHGRAETMVAVEIDVPKVLAGTWQVVGVLKSVEDKTIVHSVAGSAIPDRFADGDAATCECCRKKRHRNLTLVLRDSVTGNHAQVGTDCVRQYVGTEVEGETVAKVILDILQLESDALASARQFTHGEPCSYTRQGVNLLAYLGHVAQIVLNAGRFVTAAEAVSVHGRSTKQDALVHMQADQPVSDEAQNLAFVARQHVIAEGLCGSTGDVESDIYDIIVGSVSVLQDVQSDFIRNLRVVAMSNTVPVDCLGIAAFIVEYYRRHIKDQERKMRLERAARTSTHVGQPGDRLRDLALVCTNYRCVEGMQYTTHFFVFDDVKGNTYVWAASNNRCDIKAGSAVKLTGTVRAHTEYKGVKQTKLTRCTASVQPSNATT